MEIFDKNHGILNYRDLFLLSFVPIVLVLIYLLPQGLQSGLILDTGSPFFFNFFTTAFVHQNLRHLLGNTVSYALVILPAFLMCALMGRKKRFYGGEFDSEKFWERTTAQTYEYYDFCEEAKVILNGDGTVYLLDVGV